MTEELKNEEFNAGINEGLKLFQENHISISQFMQSLDKCLDKINALKKLLVLWMDATADKSSKENIKEARKATKEEMKKWEEA